MKLLRIKRTAIALVGLFLILSGVAAYTLARAPVQILAPESSEEIARRQSTDNAYQTLSEAARLLPQDSFRGRNSANSGEEEEGGGPPWARGAFPVERPDSDRRDDVPYLQRRAERWLPAAEAARAAFTKPYFRLPITWADCGTLNNSWYPADYGDVVFLGRAMATEGSYLAATPATVEAGVRWLLDAVKLGAMQSSDGSGKDGREIQNDALKRLCGVARLMDKTLLESAFAEIHAARGELTPPLRNLDFEWRVLDNTRRQDKTYRENMSGFWSLGIAQSAQDAVFVATLQHVRGLVASHQAEFQEILSLPYPKALIWLEAHANLVMSLNERRVVVSILGRGYWPLLRPVLNPVETLRGQVENYARVRTWFAGAETALALERYRQDHGAYPESLEALVPDYLDNSMDPFSGQPLEYRTENADYVLSSAGPVPRGGFSMEDSQFEMVLHPMGAPLRPASRPQYQRR